MGGRQPPRMPLAGIPFPITGKGQRCRVDAIAQPGRTRSIRKHMTKMRVATVAVHLGTPHEKAVVLGLADSVIAKRVIEAWPATSRIELCPR